MKVLIVGATGYLGSHIAAHLSRNGHVVEGTSRRPGDRRLPEGVSRLHRWSADEVLPVEAIDGADAIVVVTGESVVGRWTRAKKRRMWESRVGAARNVVEGIERSPHKPSVLVGASAVGYYGDRGDDELTEDEPPGDDFLSGLTAEWEAAFDGASSSGVRVVNVRTGHVIGEGAPFLKPFLPVWKLGLGGRLGNGRQFVPWVHVDDYTAVVQRAIEDADIAGPINVVAPGSVRQRDFAKALGRALHRPVFTWAPAVLIRLATGELANEVLTSKRAVPEALARAGFAFAYPEVGPALVDAVS